MLNKFHVKIGEIELNLEGDADYIEKERNVFFGNVLPQAVEAMTRTTYVTPQRAIGNCGESVTMLESSPQPVKSTESNVLLVISPTEFLNSKKPNTQQDLALCLAYYEEKYKTAKDFSSEDINTYFKTARIPVPSNSSMIINVLVQKGYLMDSPKSDTIPKRYIITNSGIKLIEGYEPKPQKEGKTSKLRKPRIKIDSSYIGLTADDLNLNNYPEIKKLSSFKEKMMLVLYIVTNEKKGTDFTTNDILYIMTDVLGEDASVNQIKGIFKDNKTWFKVEVNPENKNIVKRKLLNKGLDYAKSISIKA